MPSEIVAGTEFHFRSANDGRMARKYSNYFEIYDRYLGKYSNRRPRILEIGVQHGGSLRLWNGYFDGNVDIFGMDILPECKKFERDNVEIFIGDQSDEAFLRDVARRIGKVDVIIDDGSHVPSHQIASFKILFFNALADDGIYICEDCHTSYWKHYGGGLRRRGTFIEYAKRLCDQINAWHADAPRLAADEATHWIKSISFFSSVVVFERAKMSAPEPLSAGVEEIDLEAPFKTGSAHPIVLRLKRVRFVQIIVRRNPVLWNAMRRLIK